MNTRSNEQNHKYHKPCYCGCVLCLTHLPIQMPYDESNIIKHATMLSLKINSKSEESTACIYFRFGKKTDVDSKKILIELLDYLCKNKKFMKKFTKLRNTLKSKLDEFKQKNHLTYQEYNYYSMLF